jgi:di/tricarboxylate transporter
VGVLEIADLRRIPYRTIIFAATALSMSSVLAATSALPLLTRDTIGWMRPLLVNRWSATLVLFWGAFAFHLLLGAQNLMLTATMPAVLSLGVSAGYSPVVVGLVWVFGTAGRLFPYQSGVLMVGYSYGYFDGADLIKLGLLLAILESILLLLVVPLYWPLIGLS